MNQKHIVIAWECRDPFSDYYKTRLACIWRHEYSADQLLGAVEFASYHSSSMVYVGKTLSEARDELLLDLINEATKPCQP